ncbi:MAG: hypothetical protein OJF52_003885 [Nitrospira sp.]|jgi:hypothetical protein|nr:MAG: hypothetical protein OJF52_003885 [Nitrospira sp.]
MERKRWRVFLDTSALIAGGVSPTGAAREVLRLAEARVIELIMSRQVLAEADRNLAAKLPTLLDDYHLLLRQLAPVVVEDPSHAAAQRGRPSHPSERWHRFWRQPGLRWWTTLSRGIRATS